MKVVTEAYLRALFRNGSVTEFTLAEGQIMTPSARGFLTDRQVKILSGKKASAAAPVKESAAEPNRTQGTPQENEAKSQAPSRPRYVSAQEGGTFDEKPEFMTHLRGNRLVVKTHDRIIFRGKLDSFQSMILMVQVRAQDQGKSRLVNDLQEILDWVRAIMKADVLNTLLEKESVLGLTPAELREQSHNPKKALGVDHIFPSVDMGADLVKLNHLRSQAREMELAGVRAFYREFEAKRPDILTALNRMSSAIYIMMARERAGFYAPGQEG